MSIEPAAVAEGDLISSPPSFLRAGCLLAPGMFALLSISTIYRMYFAHTVEPSGLAVAMALLAFTMFFIVGCVVFPKLADAVYAQPGLLTIRRDTAMTRIPYGDIERFRIFRGARGSTVWIRLRFSGGFGRHILFCPANDYQASWASRTATQALLKMASSSE